MLWYALFGFLLFYKAAYCLMNYELFTKHPADFVFSLKGNWLWGIAGAAVFVLWIWYIKKVQQTDKPAYKELNIYPSERTDRLLFWNAAIGFIGAILFAKLDQLPLMFTDPKTFFTTYNGLVFYGGLFFGAMAFFYITIKRMGVRLIDAMDVGSPGMMLAYGSGRVGCHLSGDGDWGIVNLNPKPAGFQWLPDWAWAYTYPHNVNLEGQYIPGCADTYCTELVQPVYPTSLYESLICMGFFTLLWIFRHQFVTRGLMFSVFILLNGIERFFMEFIKVNPKHCLGNICYTQAQWIALLFIVMGVAGLIWIYRNKQKAKKQNRPLT